jgi:hypothetical protein
VTSRASSRASAAATAAAAALIAGCVLASAPAASASAVRSADPAAQTFHCRVRIEAEILFIRFDMFRSADVVATTVARAASAAQAKVNAALPVDATATSAECTAIA